MSSAPQSSIPKNGLQTTCTKALTTSAASAVLQDTPHKIHLQYIGLPISHSLHPTHKLAPPSATSHSGLKVNGAAKLDSISSLYDRCDSGTGPFFIAIDAVRYRCFTVATCVGLVAASYILWTVESFASLRCGRRISYWKEGIDGADYTIRFHLSIYGTLQVC